MTPVLFIYYKQEGGIMKYWAEHPDTDGLDSLRCEYRKECAKTYREENKWEMSEADMAKRALGWEHIANESDYFDNLKEALSTAGEEVSSWRGWVSKFTLDYLGRDYGTACKRKTRLAT